MNEINTHKRTSPHFILPYFFAIKESNLAEDSVQFGQRRTEDDRKKRRQTLSRRTEEKEAMSHNRNDGSSSNNRRRDPRKQPTVLGNPDYSVDTAVGDDTADVGRSVVFPDLPLFSSASQQQGTGWSTGGRGTAGRTGTAAATDSTKSTSRRNAPEIPPSSSNSSGVTFTQLGAEVISSQETRPENSPDFTIKKYLMIKLVLFESRDPDGKKRSTKKIQLSRVESVYTNKEETEPKESQEIEKIKLSLKCLKKLKDILQSSYNQLNSQVEMAIQLKGGMKAEDLKTKESRQKLASFNETYLGASAGLNIGESMPTCDNEVQEGKRRFQQLQNKDSGEYGSKQLLKPSCNYYELISFTNPQTGERQRDEFMCVLTKSVPEYAEKNNPLLWYGIAMVLQRVNAEAKYVVDQIIMTAKEAGMFMTYLNSPKMILAKEFPSTFEFTSGAGNKNNERNVLEKYEKSTGFDYKYETSFQKLFFKELEESIVTVKTRFPPTYVPAPTTLSRAIMEAAATAPTEEPLTELPSTPPLWKRKTQPTMPTEPKRKRAKGPSLRRTVSRRNVKPLMAAAASASASAKRMQRMFERQQDDTDGGEEQQGEEDYDDEEYSQQQQEQEFTTEEEENDTDDDNDKEKEEQKSGEEKEKKSPSDEEVTEIMKNQPEELGTKKKSNKKNLKSPEKTPL